MDRDGSANDPTRRSLILPQIPMCESPTLPHLRHSLVSCSAKLSLRRERVYSARREWAQKNGAAPEGDAPHTWTHR